MTLFLLLLASVCVLLNLNAPNNLSSVSPIILICEFGGVVSLAYFIIKKHLCNCVTIGKDGLRQFAGKPLLLKYFNFFLFGFIISLLILYFCWTPFLSPLYKNWGFDAQRYYDAAQTLALKGYINEWGNVNWIGVIYIYALFFKTLGVDPLIPLYVNSILSLECSLCLMKMIQKDYNISPISFSYLLLIPEILYFNVMSSREIICLFGVIWIIYSFSRLYSQRRYSTIIPLIIGSLLLGLTRPHYLVAVVISIIIYMFIIRGRRISITNILLVIIIIGSVFISFNYGNLLGSNDDTASFSQNVTERMSGQNIENEAYSYTNNSIAASLIPTNPINFVVYGLIRCFLYLMPSPTISSSLTTYSDSYLYAENLINISGLLLLLAVPFVVLLIKKMRHLSNSLTLLLICFLVLYLIIGMFNTTLIHERYRICYDMLYFTLFIVALKITPKFYQKKIIIRWIFVILILIGVYFIYKMI